MKRLLSIILTISMILGSCGAVFAEEVSELITENQPEIIEEEILPEEIEEVTKEEFVAEEPITEEELLPDEELPENETEDLSEELTEEQTDEQTEDLFEEFPEEIVEEDLVEEPMEEVEETPPVREYDQSVIDFINNNPINVGSSSDNNQMTTIGEITNVDNAELLEKETDELNATTYSVSATNSVVPDDFKVAPVNSPYYEYVNGNEGVSLGTGAMTYNKTLLSLPGRNGFDLNLSINYNSQSAVITENEFDKEATIREIDFNKFAIGWDFGFSSITNPGNHNYGYDSIATINLENGESYGVYKDEDDTGEEYEILGYTLDDMTLVKDTETSQYILTYPNGTKEYFDETYGCILKKVDIYGNAIEFEYEDLDYYRGSFLDYIFRPSFYTAKLHVLSQITDSAGREVDIEYSMRTGLKGKSVSKIEIKVGNTIYATLNLDRIESYNGEIDVLSSIVDGEGLETSFEYSEELAYIYNRQEEPSYVVNGSNVMITKVNHPTGSYANYTYSKERRSYAYKNGDEIIIDWYEIYKVRSHKDSSGNEIKYRYQGDYSGYPYAYLDENKDMGEPVEAPGAQYVHYSTIVTDAHTETIHTFNNVHKKIKKQTYSVENGGHKYIETQGSTWWDAVVDNEIYRVYNKDGYIFVCKQAEDDYETVFLEPMSYESNYEIKAVKTHYSDIYVFYTKNSTENGMYMYGVYKFDTITGTWLDLTTYESNTQYDMSNLLYYNGSFYAYLSSSYQLKHMVFNTVNGGSWSEKEPVAVDTIIPLEIICVSHDGTFYYFCDGAIYRYNPSTNIISRRSFPNFRERYFYFGFTCMGANYIAADDKIYQFDFSSGTTSNEHSYPEGVHGYDAVYQGTDGYIYFFPRECDKNGRMPIYRFCPDIQGDDAWTYLTDRTFGDCWFSVFMGYDCAYICVERGSTASGYMPDSAGTGFDKIDISPQGNFSQILCTNYSYNSDKLLTNKEQYTVKGKDISEKLVETYNYVSGTSVVANASTLDNSVSYEYNESEYYIPTSISQSSATAEQIVTTNTLSADKKRIDSSITQYDGRSIKTVNLYSTDHPGNVVSKSVYEIKGDVETLIGVVDFEYDSAGALITKEKVKNVVTNGTDFSLLTAEDYSTNYAYDDMGNLVSTTNAKGQTTTYTYNKNNWPLRTTYPDGTYVQNTYYLNGNNNRIVTSHNGKYQEIDYFDSLGRTIKQIESGGGLTVTIAEYIYDGNRLDKVTDANNNYTKYIYDPFGRVTTLQTYSSDHTLVDTQSVTYDDINLSKTVNHGGKTKTQKYDVKGRLIREEQNTDAGLNFVDYTYDRMDNVILTEFANNTQVLNVYNNENQLVSTTNQIGQQTTYEYDKFGNVSKVTLPSGKTLNYGYDNAGRMISATDTAEATEHYAYDKIGNVIAFKDKKGQVTTNTYNNMNRLTNTATGDISTSYTYDTLGNQLTMTDSTGTTGYTYVLGSRLSKITNPDTKTIEYTYDGVGNVTQVKDYNNKTVGYTYDALNRVTNVNAVSQGIDLNITYTNFGTIGSIDNADYVKTYTYDNALRVTREASSSCTTGQGYFGFNYTYDIVGNQIQKKNTKKGVVYITNYTYDDIGRLTSEQIGDSTTTYTFDADNNISTKSVSYTSPATVGETSGVTAHLFNYSYDNGNRLLSESQTLQGTTTATGSRAYTYDANGNRLTETKSGFLGTGTNQYAYNALNQLTSYIPSGGTVTTYTYDGDGARVTKTTGNSTTKFYWDRGYVVNEATNGTINVTNFIGPQGIFGRKTGTSYPDSFVKNAHGDVMARTSDNTAYDYDAYGNLLTDNMDDSNPFRYCGEYQDSESGLIYLRNRYYDPTVSRFINEDPIKDGTNWYAYCGNNPIAFVDPWGLEMETDYEEFYLQGYKAEYYRLVELGDAWRDTKDEAYRQELHAEAELLRALTRVHISNSTISWRNPICALNDVLLHNSSIYDASETSGVPAEMISAILYQESLQRDPLDNKIAESIISKVRGDASFGIGQVRAETAIRAEKAFFDSATPLHTREEMQGLLQSNNATNIQYVAFTLWHCGADLGTVINKDYNFDNADRVFQGYNPNSFGYGSRVFSYMQAFQDYYEVVLK